jgi:hypothetical protein
MAPAVSPQRRVRTVRHCPIEERLDPQHHPALRVMVLESDTPLVAVARWLESVGCPTSKAALCRYRQRVRGEAGREAEAVLCEASRAVGFGQLARGPRPPDFITPAVFLCELLSVMSLVLLRGRPGVGPQLVLRHARAAEAVAGLRAQLDARKQSTREPGES